MVTRKPLACKSLASEAEIIPFPSEEVTPPVTKIYFAADAVGVGVERSGMTGDKVTLNEGQPARPTPPPSPESASWQA
jgi:hypothetical protein